MTDDHDRFATDAEMASAQGEIDLADLTAAYPDLAAEPDSDEARERRERFSTETSLENLDEIERYRKVYGADWYRHFQARDLDDEP